MNAEDQLNRMERIITRNPAAHNPAWTREINNISGRVKKEICDLRRFAGLNLQSKPAEYCLSRAQFLEDRLNELLTIYQKEG